MRTFIYGMVTTALLLACIDGKAEVFKCKDADGGVVYQQTPCPTPEKENDETEEDTSAPAEGDEMLEGSTEIETTEPKSSGVVAQCKKKYRDAIDAIDAEMHLSYTPEQADHYKQQLRALTEQLRDC